jgi:plasmid stabilization system protein ParE
MKVLWTKNAIEHPAGIYDYIAVNSPAYAKRMVDKITKRSLQIAGMPYSGRQVPEYEEDDVRELIEYPYRIIYRIKIQSAGIQKRLHETESAKFSDNYPGFYTFIGL